MKQITINCYEVQSSDQEGWRYNHTAYVSTKTLAKELTEKLTKIRKWPHRYIKYEKTFNICESLEDFKTKQKKEN